MTPLAIEAVTFDFWRTIAYEHPGHTLALRRDAWLGVLGAAGHAVEPDAVDDAFRAAWHTHEAAWLAGRNWGPLRASEHACDLLELPHGPLREQLAAAFVDAGRGIDLPLADGLERCLRSLGTAGVRLGIVCDVGFTSGELLRAFLARRGLLELFHGWAFSDEVGVYKPAAAIFRHALSELGGVEEARAAHVGDLRRTDVAGARALGMRAVRYTGIHDDPGPGEEGDHVISHHDELPAVLGLG